MIILFVLLLAMGETVTPDDVIKLVKSGAGDEVVISHLDAQRAVFSLSTDDIVRLKENGVSDRILGRMIGPVKNDLSAATGRSILLLFNQDDRAYSVMIDEQAKRIFYYFGNMQDRMVLSKGGTRDVPVSPGTYAIRWVGEPRAFTVTIREGETAKAIVSPVRFTGYSAANIALFEGDREVGDGILKTFEDRRQATEHQHPAPVAQTVQTQPTIIYRTTEPVIVHHAYPYASSYRRSLFSPNTILWTGIGVAAYRHRRWKGAAIGFSFGHLLDHWLPYDGCR